ncbi:MAG: putative nucleic-acid-binding protein containing a Zn-ribbon [Verrucomicrobiaceae bacterium]|nr:putative nucleic-acid-binding protein containing a Zn-ribbon [Verrucomicrobiaceae bacterium]
MTARILPDLDYQTFLKEGRFMIQRSASSGSYVFYPRTVAPGTGADDLEWVPASGRGVVYSTTVVRVKPPAVSYNVALIELEEGPRMMSRVETIEPEQVTIGMPVRARIAQENDFAFLVFDPA